MASTTRWNIIILFVVPVLTIIMDYSYHDPVEGTGNSAAPVSKKLSTNDFDNMVKLLMYTSMARINHCSTNIIKQNHFCNTNRVRLLRNVFPLKRKKSDNSSDNAKKAACDSRSRRKKVSIVLRAYSSGTNI
ncbi:hypothetical protein BDC45DRAFT_559145 [Circinella umbellata]|nr:hypothetical protein BDC45DRAFT_559145 [Circinella umbellata]